MHLSPCHPLSVLALLCYKQAFSTIKLLLQYYFLTTMYISFLETSENVFLQQDAHGNIMSGTRVSASVYIKTSQVAVYIPVCPNSCRICIKGIKEKKYNVQYFGKMGVIIQLTCMIAVNNLQ